MIPKIIHFCWFGPHPLPESARRFVGNWQERLPDYQILHWDESRFDVDALPYTQAAYAAGRYAFVADVCRLQALYEHGGLYFDTDVEVTGSFDAFLNHPAFAGFEEGTNPYTREKTCSPQAGVMGSAAGGRFIGEVLAGYEKAEFDAANPVTINRVFADVFQRHGIVCNNTLQTVSDYLTVYPADYFMAKNAYTLEDCRTVNTVSIHHYDGTWLQGGKTEKWRRCVIAMLSRLFGAGNAQKIVSRLKALRNNLRGHGNG